MQFSLSEQICLKFLATHKFIFSVGPNMIIYCNLFFHKLYHSIQIFEEKKLALQKKSNFIQEIIQSEILIQTLIDSIIK